MRKSKPSRKRLNLPRVPPIKKVGGAHKDRRKADPKHKTNWNRLDDLYQD